MFISEGLVEQHIHGAFGVDFMNCSKDELIFASQKLALCGVTAFFPTIMTDDLDKIKERIILIKQVMNEKIDKSSQIAGIHLEGPFINPEKSGIHQKQFIKPLDVNIFQQIEDEIIKIVTLSPELDFTGNFIDYLKHKNIKISAGHCSTNDLSKVNQVTHLYNAMGSFNHRNSSTVVSALSNDDIFTEIIADSKHVNDEVLKITFTIKPLNKVLLISDALPLARSEKTNQTFAGQMIYNKNGNLVNENGTIAGSSSLLCDIIKNISDKRLLTLKDAIKASSSNQLNYHNIKNKLKVFWNKFNSIEKVEFIKINLF